MASRFIWYELITSDLDAAIAFYGKVVGWSVQPGTTPGMDYRMIHAGEKAVGGMMAMPEMADASGMRPGWFAYVDVPDVDAGVRAFETAGGKVLWPANDLPEVGRMAMVSDPQGAPLYLMTPLRPADAGSEPFDPKTEGHCGWNEYHARDAAAALDFYAGHLGWQKSAAMDMGEMGVYQTFTADGVQTGGIMNNPHAPPSWLFYFNTGDIDAAAGRIEKAGGAIQLPPMQVPGGQWALVARDPQDAMFGLLGTRPE
jgi:predicted enzyme related to lactoylglutathione lyase